MIQRREGGTDASLFLLDRQPLRADVDVHPFGRRLVLPIELIAERGDGDHQGANDKVKDVGASHAGARTLRLRSYPGSSAGETRGFERLFATARRLRRAFCGRLGTVN